MKVIMAWQEFSPDGDDGSLKGKTPAVFRQWTIKNNEEY